uniref:Uncharacterized protein n=1 Tax=Cacopsylla melanoneura TaxID=428564 RepID=A0A8D8VJ30_9HEMI
MFKNIQKYQTVEKKRKKKTNNGNNETPQPLSTPGLCSPPLLFLLLLLSLFPFFSVFLKKHFASYQHFNEITLNYNLLSTSSPTFYFFSLTLTKNLKTLLFFVFLIFCFMFFRFIIIIAVLFYRGKENEGRKCV